MSENLHIDLNSDLGESFGRYNLGMDSEILPADRMRAIR